MKTQSVLPFKLEATEERITSHSGLALFGEFLHALGLPDFIDGKLPGPGSATGYKPHEFVIPLLLSIHGGGTSLEDLRMIRRDIPLQQLLGISGVPSSDAFGDWLLRMGERAGAILGMREVHKRIVRRMLNRHQRSEFTLDIDAFLIECEKREAEMSYKGKKGYMPIVGHLAELGMIIGYEFRKGNVSPGARNLEFTKKCLANMPKNKRITAFRADSASYQAELFNFLEQENIQFAIGGRLDISVKNQIDLLHESKWRPYQNGHITEIVHCMEHTHKAFRLILIRRPIQPSLPDMEENEDPYERYRAIATNRSESAEQVVDWYNQRGDTSENRIRDLKSGFHMDSMPCGKFAANKLYFSIGVLAHNLHVFFRDHVLPQEWKGCRIQTIRWRFYQIAGKVVTHARDLILKVADWAFELFREVRSRCRELVPIRI